ncbi:MAG: hypothetical protein IJL32_15825 [Oscillospiraceae bacterium]|nr:hypothetical protein [Oscillospiraceae bacterium]
MIPMLEVFPSVPGMLIYIAALMLLLLQFAVLLHSMQDKGSKRSLRCAVLHFIVSFLIVGLMLCAANAYKILDPGEVLVPGSLPDRIFSVPWIVFAAWDIWAAWMTFLQIRQYFRYVKTHLAQNAVKETLDWLPVGVCISDTEGTVLLYNLKIDALSQNLTDQHLLDSRSFWEQVTKKGTAQDHGYLLQTTDGHAYLFTKTPLTLHEKGKEKHFEQMIASDMTDAYRITQELTANNKHLKEVQYRMKEVAAYERSLIAAREIIKARTAVHNQMGSVLLSGKYYLDHPDGMNEAELLRLLEYNNYFLLREAENQEKETDVLQKALKTAQCIGVTVEFKGTLPERETAREILAQAIEQCAANTVRHAEGNCITVTLTETDEQIIAEFRNNGKAPEQPVTETGGLLYLRKAAEAAGGTVTVQSTPVFVLTVSVPKT